MRTPGKGGAADMMDERAAYQCCITENESFAGRQFKTEDLLWMELYDYSLTKITTTDVGVYEENINEEAVRMFLVEKIFRDVPKEHCSIMGLTIKR